MRQWYKISGIWQIIFACSTHRKIKIIVLRAVILSAKTTRLPNQRRPRHKKMGNIVIGPQKIQIKIRFKMGLKMLGKVCRYLIFIGINHIPPAYFLSPPDVGSSFPPSDRAPAAPEDRHDPKAPEILPLPWRMLHWYFPRFPRFFCSSFT